MKIVYKHDNGMVRIVIPTPQVLTEINPATGKLWTVEEIADEIGKTVRGVKTMLTRRGLQCANYNGAAKKEIG